MKIKLLVLRMSKLISIAKKPRLLRCFFKYRVLAGTEHGFLFGVPFSTVVDIGANRGQFSLVAWAFSKAKIHAFEPLPEPANCFRKIFSDIERVSFYETAIGETLGSATIHISARDDSSSLLKIGDRQSEIFPGTHEVGVKEIPVGPLDSYLDSEDIQSPALLKLDVQGYELQALIGCSTLIDRFEYIYCECSFVALYEGQSLITEVIELLSANKFVLNGVFNTQKDLSGSCIQADFLFKRETGSE